MSWFSKFFGGKSEAEPSFFGIQLLIKAFGEDTTRARLANVINQTEENLEDIAAKRRYLKRIIAVLIEQEAFWTQAFWDYKVGADAAAAEFDTWYNEIAASTATEHEEFGQVDGAYRLSNKKDYVAVTMIFQFATRFVAAEMEDETLWWKHQTIKELINQILLVSPENILADGVFIIPGSSEDGLSEEDILTGGWNYLHVIL
jgi:hypothetical protein